MNLGDFFHKEDSDCVLQANSSIMSALMPNLECSRLAIGIVMRLIMT